MASSNGEGSALPARGRRPNPRLDQMKRTWYLLRKNTLAMIGVGLLVFFAVLFVASFFYHASATTMTQYCGTYYSGYQFYPTSVCQNPICTYPPGSLPPVANCYLTDPNNPSFVAPTFSLSPFHLGPLPFGSLSTDPGAPVFYNMFDGIVKGSEWSITISVAIVAVGASVGLLLGATAGVSGGLVDEAIMRTTDIFLSVPQLLLVLVLIIVLEPVSIFSSLSGRVAVLIIGFSITWWPFYTRIVRSQVVVVREQKYVEAARASGAGTGRILRKHIIPNSLFPVFVQIALDVGSIPLIIGAIIFLGVQVWPTPVFPEWGSLAGASVSSQIVGDLFLGGVTYYPWWQLFFPGITLFLFAISVNFFSDGLRDALDPRLRR
ncbi:MAG TPA: ABC transporter permease [Thermoplasmata archaeon]|nr:ABC transporter permease [Thermoplasmata archaeon]